MNHVFQQLVLCVAGNLFTHYLRKYSVLQWIILIGKRRLNYIYDLYSGKSQHAANLSID